MPNCVLTILILSSSSWVGNRQTRYQEVPLMDSFRWPNIPSGEHRYESWKGKKIFSSFYCWRNLLSLQFFKGNADEDTPVTNMFQCPVIAKCIRINPLDWKNNIGMRLDLIGCPLGLFWFEPLHSELLSDAKQEQRNCIEMLYKLGSPKYLPWYCLFSKQLCVQMELQTV